MGAEADTSLGLRWKKIGKTRPDAGHEIIHDDLAAVLMDRVDFTQAELEKFNLAGRLSSESFIKAGETYFKPEALDTDVCEFEAAMSARHEAAIEYLQQSWKPVVGTGFISPDHTETRNTVGGSAFDFVGNSTSNDLSPTSALSELPSSDRPAARREQSDQLQPSLVATIGYTLSSDGSQVSCMHEQPHERG